MNVSVEQIPTELADWIIDAFRTGDFEGEFVDDSQGRSLVRLVRLTDDDEYRAAGFVYLDYADRSAFVAAKTPEGDNSLVTSKDVIEALEREHLYVQGLEAQLARLRKFRENVLVAAYSIGSLLLLALFLKACQ